jgi:peptidoglycan/LPS O-acetylase OafA/YrhL
VKATRSSYQPELDIVRAFAFFAVFLSHWIYRDLPYYMEHHVPWIVAKPLNLLSYAGSFGVMVFFCLSSYLITGLLLKEISSQGHINVPSFYMRRVLRIWPLYMVFIALALVLAWIDPNEKFGWKQALAFFFFSGNWIWSLGFAVDTVATPLWSISVEEQFYLVWPWLVRRATAKGLRKTALVLMLIAALNRVLVITHVIHADLWHNTFTQLDSIALGTLLAVGVPLSWNKFRDSQRPLIFVTGLLGIYFGQALSNIDVIEWKSFITYPLSALCSAAILWSMIGVRLNRESPVVKAFVHLGKISYGLYVFHTFCIYVVTKLLAHLPFHPHFIIGFTARGVGGMALTIFLATISYRWMEEPILKLKKRFSPGSDALTSLGLAPVPTTER